jgi:hypothetical protein
LNKLLAEREEIGHRMDDISKAESSAEDLIIKSDAAITELHECICEMEEIE